MTVTFRDVLNRAFILTGEPQIDSGTSIVTDTEQLLYAEAANEIKEEVEAAHNWRALLNNVVVSYSASATGASMSTLDTSTARVARIMDPKRGCEVPLVFDMTDPSNPTPLREMDLPDLIYRQITDTTDGTPVHFAIENTFSETMSLRLYPTPSTARTIWVYMYTPQSRLNAGVAEDLDATIFVPVRPIVNGLVRFIFEDRGEELGINSRYSQEKWETALRDLISLDAAESGEYNLVPQ